MKPYFETELGQLYCGDCLDIMPNLNCKVDMIFADLPYGVTAALWDKEIPFDKLWENYIPCISPLPSLTAHLHKTSLSPLIDWEKEIQKIKI